MLPVTYYLLQAFKSYKRMLEDYRYVFIRNQQLQWRSVLGPKLWIDLFVPHIGLIDSLKLDPHVFPTFYANAAWSVRDSPYKFTHTVQRLAIAYCSLFP